jgi:6-phosphofructokinase 1
MASHIILPPDDEQQRREDEEADEPPPPPGHHGPAAATTKAALPFSAMCVRISRDSYPNLRALRNASNVSLADAAYVKISEGDFGYVLDDVPHLADYIPDVLVSAPLLSLPARLRVSVRCDRLSCCAVRLLLTDCEQRNDG